MEGNQLTPCSLPLFPTLPPSIWSNYSCSYSLKKLSPYGITNQCAYILYRVNIVIHAKWLLGFNNLHGFIVKVQTFQMIKAQNETATPFL